VIRDVEVEICDMIFDMRAKRRIVRAFCPLVHVRQRLLPFAGVVFLDGSDIPTDCKRARPAPQKHRAPPLQHER
jgi:hypothetical protein